MFEILEFFWAIFNTINLTKEGFPWEVYPNSGMFGQT